MSQSLVKPCMSHEVDSSLVDCVVEAHQLAAFLSLEVCVHLPRVVGYTLHFLTHLRVPCLLCPKWLWSIPIKLLRRSWH